MCDTCRLIERHLEITHEVLVSLCRHVCSLAGPDFGPAKFCPELFSSHAKPYKKYKKSAAVRGLRFSITREDFELLTSSPCRYCRHRGNCGLDRLDSSVGYRVDNLASCCTTCNFMKLGMDEETFYRHCASVAREEDHFPVDRPPVKSSAPRLL
ncbi:MAG: hypothetical protein ACYCOU_12155 [Sulfobacillus sp.]